MAVPARLTLLDVKHFGIGIAAGVLLDILIVRPLLLPATVGLYTSGTTGPPKGCMLTLANFIGAMRSRARRLDLSDAVVDQFLPLAHVLARITQTVAIEVGGTIAFWSGDPKKVVDEVAEFAPTHFPAVPRVYEKIHTKVLDQAESGGALRRAIFRWALAQGRRACRRAPR